ncbi:RnfABCDGE type electron transport complex subunit D [Pyxidicoccus sp. MSG2]|uniref:RnfABCDGE type electron transport complex subunit D n=1 Tax=Pyxidicoccus sp. MSG2 TaxID=2996790 RepID=UPI00226FB5D2|nr:RnfABCDGE type electron transport complex subunit D [Pyxidicoccus sp. MSG2]MCY1021109.1 RnfABCDGE type electron transport complex subunit D [Pyxidicoccus sp. MSG2]
MNEAMKTWSGDLRVAGLRRFAVAITLLNVLGHTVLGFEQAWAHPLVSLLAAYSAELLLEWAGARSQGRAPRFLGGAGTFIDFLLPAHITGLAVAMLLYANAQLLPVAFASATAIASKTLFRVPVGGQPRHYLNPSNFGITATLLLFPHIGIAPPYHFTENLRGPADWVLPAIIVCTGTFLNARFTRRIPLILGWLGGFLVQAAVRSAVAGTPLTAALVPMTGVAFVLYTFYMVTDPGTTPQRPAMQVCFGAGVAAAYGMLVAVHVVFDLFFSLTLICAARGGALYVQAMLARRAEPLPGVTTLSVQGEPRT